MNKPMTPNEEYEFFNRPENQEPQGPGRRRLSATVPVRFPPNCWSKYALRPPQTTAPSRPGFAAQSSMSYAIPPNPVTGSKR